MNSSRRLPVLLVLVLALLLASGPAAAVRGRVVNAADGTPVEGAVVTGGDRVIITDADGMFEIASDGGAIAARAPGFARATVPAGALQGGTARIELVPFTPKALYLSFYGIGSSALRQPALDLIDATELNAVVIDVKGDRGMIAYPSTIPLAAQVGAQKVITIGELETLTASLRRRGIYTIARIVVFKDDLLAHARPELAVKTADGTIWRDREGLAWTDPTQTGAWNYNIEVAVEAARAGFDEIQFDYLRFPDAGGLVFSKPATEDTRVEAITRFLEEARRRLVPFNVFVAADIFGYVCWNLNDTDIGQKLEAMLPHVDYLSPMLYPSSFHVGIPGYRNPVAHPYEIVHRSLVRAQERTGASRLRFRPWLQAFRDYAFDGRTFGAEEVRVQIKAAEDFGSNGWMLWNPRNVYSAGGLRSDESHRP